MTQLKTNHTELADDNASISAYSSAAANEALLPQGLKELEKRLAQDIQWLNLPTPEWVPAKQINGQKVHDVIIIGAGMAGLAAGTALKNIGINALILDAAETGLEGPWATTARMETLRSPKHLTGPALGLPALTFRAWFESQWGRAAWDTLDKIPRLQWMDYLRWYRSVVNLNIRNNCLVTRIQPFADHVLLTVNDDGKQTQYLANRLILATGRAGLGGPFVPDFMQGIARKYWAHSSDELDYSAMAGKHVGVIGAGASAMDSAATALENDASRLDMLVRRTDLPRINKGKGSGNPGFTFGYKDLPDEWKWRIRHYINQSQVPPPRGSTLRVTRHNNAHLFFGCVIYDVQEISTGLIVNTSKGEFKFDFLFLATGFKIDWESRSEYADIAPHILTWAERYQPENGELDRELSDSPDLGEYFEFKANSDNAPGLSRIHCLCYPATMSHGTVSGDIPAISDGAERIAQGIAGLLFNENIATHFELLEAYDEPELLGDEWIPK